MKLQEVWLRDSLPIPIPGASTTRCVRANDSATLAFENGFVVVTPKERPPFMIPLAFVACMTPLVDAKKGPAKTEAAKPAA